MGKLIDQGYIKARGTKENYTSNQDLYEDIIYFATDTLEILLNGKSYGQVTETDLSDYFTKEEVNNLIKDLPTDGALLQIREDLENKLDKEEYEFDKGSFLTEANLSGYATELFVKEEIKKIDFPDEFDPDVLTGLATEEWVKEQGYLKEHQSLEDYYNKEEVDKAIDGAKEAIVGEDLKDSLDTLETIKLWKEQHGTEYTDLLETVNSKIDASAIEDMATQTWVEGKISEATLQGVPGKDGTNGKDGKTWKPSVSASGDLSWTEDSSSTTPATVNIKGPKGDPGDSFMTQLDKDKLDGIANGAEVNKNNIEKIQTLVGNSINTYNLKKSDHESLAFATSDNSGINLELSNKGTVTISANKGPNGLCPLDSSGKIDASYLPTSNSAYEIKINNTTDKITTSEDELQKIFDAYIENPNIDINFVLDPFQDGLVQIIKCDAIRTQKSNGNITLLLLFGTYIMNGLEMNISVRFTINSGRITNTSLSKNLNIYILSHQLADSIGLSETTAMSQKAISDEITKLNNAITDVHNEITSVPYVSYNNFFGNSASIAVDGSYKDIIEFEVPNTIKSSKIYINLVDDSLLNDNRWLKGVSKVIYISGPNLTVGHEISISFTAHDNGRPPTSIPVFLNKIGNINLSELAMDGDEVYKFTIFRGSAGFYITVEKLDLQKL